MPTISAFFGIAIRMYYDDHGPAHFHAYYGEASASIVIDTLEVLAGDLPRRAMTMILEWAVLHRDELRTDWEMAEQHVPLARIEPLQ